MNKNILLLLNKSIEFYNSVTDSLYKMHMKSVVILLPKNMNICNTMRDVNTYSSKRLFVHAIYKNHKKACLVGQYVSLCFNPY